MNSLCHVNGLRALRASISQRPLPGTRRTFFFDPIFLPAQEALVSLHAASGVPWYLIIPISGVLHTAIFRAPLSWIISRRRSITLRTLLLAQVARSKFLKSYGDTNVDAASVSRRMSPIWQAAGLNPKDLSKGKTLNYTAIAVSLSSWFWSISLFRRLTGGMTMWGDRLAVPDESLTTEGALWFQDLTMNDPTYILPVLSTSLIVWSWIPRNRADWMTVLGKADPEKKGGMGKFRAMMVRFSLLATPLFVAGFDSLTAGSSYFVLSSLSSYRLFSWIQKKKDIDPLTGLHWDVMGKMVADHSNTDAATIIKRGKPVNWWGETIPKKL